VNLEGDKGKAAVGRIRRRRRRRRFANRPMLMMYDTCCVTVD